jgi:hypothetical protein
VNDNVHESLQQKLPTHCQADTPERCITCSDEMLTVHVLHVDEANQLALVRVADATEEVDISLLTAVAPGERLLVHGGVAIDRAH